jgi:putative transposase
MARPLRLLVPGGVYHVTSKGVARSPLFRDDEDRERFLDLLGKVVARHDWACHAYCLMTTHYHVVVRTPNANLAVGMQQLNGAYAQGFNHRHAMRGHVLESRYGAVLIEREAHLLEAIRYVVLNPVRAGICADPEDWPWSSYCSTIGAASPCRTFLTPAWVLAHFGSDPYRARERLRAFVLDAPDIAAA